MKNRIAFISEHASPLATLGGVDSGGQNVYVAELAKYLAVSGYQIDIFTRWDNENLPQVINWLPGIRVIHVQAGPVCFVPKEELLQHMPEFTTSMLTFIEEEEINYELVHANFFMSAWVASRLKELLDIPFVVTFHALGHVRRIHQKEQDKFPAQRLKIEEDAVKKADQIIAECPQDREDLIKYYNASPDKISIIPCGFNPSEFYPVQQTLARVILDLDPEENIILQLGRMVPRKGVDNVVKALAKSKRNTERLRLVIVGGESDIPDPVLCPEIARLQEIAKAEGVLDNITFVGRKNRDMLKYYYSAANVFITTPWYEPFGITPLESMACGTPVIGSNVGGIKYSIVNGKTGYLIPPNDAEALAGKIEHLFSNPALLKKMKVNALKRVNSMFTWAHVAKMVDVMYGKILQPVPIEIQPQLNKKSQAA
ncbi:glycosyltransferase family 4 protein [Rubrolithibacter danxiaensis]|uniref:glycosyltransferase family 4 protein n=1 Tax=Rubrolithibacter danxiaensis TaxID=3390805 RepID=UPI003BF89D0F